MSQNKKTGVQEWAAKSVNIQYGCENNCVYCYARKMAARFNRIPKLGWEHPEIKTARPPIPVNTSVMFPSTHDITHGNLHLVLSILQKILGRGNKVLIVSKPRLECIQEIYNQCRYCLDFHKELVEFRFTIGTLDDTTRVKYEPGAPTIAERYDCIKFLNDHGIEPSISCEPILEEDINGGFSIIHSLLQYCKIKEIWIGSMQYCNLGPKLNYRAIYEYYKENPKIRFKDSFFKQAQKTGVNLP